MANLEHFYLILIFFLLAQSGVVLFASLITLVSSMVLLRYARKSDELLDKILEVCKQLGTSIELAIWRG